MFTVRLSDNELMWQSTSTEKCNLTEIACIYDV